MARKISGIFTAVMLLLALAAMPALAADEPATFDHNIDYSGNLNADKYKLASNESQDYWIDLNAERLYASDPSSIKAISLDGGSKWKSGFIPQDGLDLSKIFNKISTIQIATGFDSKKKAPSAASEDGTTPAASVYTFKTINARPKIDRIVVDYLIDADKTGATNGRWVLARKGETAALKNYQIAPTLDKKNIAPVALDAQGRATVSPDGKALWGMFKISGSSVQGVNVIGLNSTGKAQKANYMIRVAPDMSTLTPASKTKKLSVSGVSKATTFKADYKKDIVKLKENAVFFSGTTEELAENTEMMSPYSKESAKNGADISDLMEKTVCMWMAATAKKPASAVQTVTFARRGVLDESLQPAVKLGKVTIKTASLEVYNESTKKWGSMPKLTEELAKTPLKIRAKATAKGGKESDTTKYAASASGQLVLEWGEYATGKNGVVSALMTAPEYEGIFRATPEKARHVVKESSSEADAIELVFSLKGLYDGTSVVLKKDYYTDKDIKMSDVPADTIWLRPSITYTPTTSPSDSLIILYDRATIADGKLTLPVVPDLACTADFKLEYSVGTSDPAYDKDRSGAVSTKIVVETVTAGVELSGLKSVYLADYEESGDMIYPPRVVVGSTKPKSGTSIRRAMTSAGEISIDHSGPARFSDELTLEGYTEFTFASAPDKNTLPVPSDFGSGAVTLTHEGWLFVKATKGTENGEDVDPIFFAYSVKDAFGPRMRSAELDSGNSNRLIVTMDEDFGSGAATSAASFMLETINSGGVTDRTWFASSVSLSGNKMTITFENPIGDVSSAHSVLTYNFGGTFSDSLGKAMQPDSLTVNGPTDEITGVSFANGSRGGAVTVALPRAVTNLSQNHSSKVAYVALGGSNSGAVTISGIPGGASVGYLISRTMISNTQTTNSFSNGDAISGLAAGDYVYLRVNSSWYVFQVVRVTAAVTTDITPPSMSSGTLIKSGGEYRVEIKTSESILNFGFGAQPDQFEVKDRAGSLANISVSEVRASGQTITLTLSGSDLNNIIPATKLTVGYKTSRNGIADVNGNRMRSLPMEKDLTLSGITNPSPSPSPSTSG